MATRLLGTAVPATVAEGGTGGATAEVARNNLGAVGILSTTTGIDGKATGTTTLYTVPMGKTAVILGASIRVTTADTITVTGDAGIGVAAGEDDIFASTTITGLLATGLVWNFDNTGATRVAVAAAGVIKLGIDTGWTATTATLAVDLIGYLV